MSKSNKIFIKVKEGLTIRDPETKQKIPAEGKWVKKTPYWIRRLAAKEVEVVKPPEKASEVSKKKAAPAAKSQPKELASAATPQPASESPGEEKGK